VFSRIQFLPPPVIALLLQVVALFSAFGIALILRSANYPVTFLLLAFLSGVIAATLSYLFKMDRWWLPIQLLFLPALILAQSVEVSPHWFLIVFLILLAVYWSTFRTQVPLYLSSEKVWHKLEKLLPDALQGKATSFIDLGSGLGGVLAHLAKARPDGRYYGVESAPLPFIWSWLRLRQKHNCSVRWGSLWDCNLAQYDVVFAYLSPVPMAQLWDKAKTEMRPGSLFISSTFNVPEQSPHQAIQIDDLHHSTLLVWHIN
jgi:hypothetical protein